MAKQGSCCSLRHFNKPAKRMLNAQGGRKKLAVRGLRFVGPPDMKYWLK